VSEKSIKWGNSKPDGPPCPVCHGKGSLRVHSPEDYGISFECEGCEACDETGIVGDSTQPSPTLSRDRVDGCR